MKDATRRENAVIYSCDGSSSTFGSFLFLRHQTLDNWKVSLKQSGAAFDRFIQFSPQHRKCPEMPS